MKYYKLSMDVEKKNGIICYLKNDVGIKQNEFNIGKKYENIKKYFEFYYDKREGDIWTDYLANDNGWFVVSKRLKQLLCSLETDIQFIKVVITERCSNNVHYDYYIANVIKVVDALCLDKSDYFETEISGLGTIYTVSKYGIYSKKTEGADVFKLCNRQEIPIFVSERFRKVIEKNNITGISLSEIHVI